MDSSRLISRWWVRFSVALIISGGIIISVAELYPKANIEENSALETFTSHLDERIPSIMNDYEIPGVIIALVKDRNTVWTKAFGYANRKTEMPMTIDTYCRVESISKSVTAWGVMKLVEQDKIDLDDPIDQYLTSWEFPDSRFSEQNITVRQLLSNSAGLPLGTIGVRYSPGQKKPTLKEKLSNDAKLMQEPGVSFSYSNTGFNLLELLIEEVTGRDFAEYMEQEVLIPLGMLNSSFNWSDKWSPPVPIGYDGNGNPIPVYVYPDKGAGGLFSTVKDIASFVTAGMKNAEAKEPTVLSSENINRLYSPQVEVPGAYGLVFDFYGLGHFIERLPNGAKAVAHGGQGSGWMTHFHSVPQSGDGIVILTNSQNSWPLFGYLLSDWARWSGFSSIGMGNIITGQKIMWAFIGLLIFISLWQSWHLSETLISGLRRFAPFAKESRILRILQISLFIVLISVLIWAANQNYLFISSVFPIATNWLGYSISLLALVLLISALTSPRR